LHFLEKTPQADLVAAFDPNPVAIAWGKQHLEPFGVRLYTDFDEMLAQPGIEAVVVAGITTEHASQTLKAIAKDKHVLCEKPLSTSVEVCQSVLEAARKKPHLKVLCGFSRRFDSSYRDAWSRVDSGSIGRATIFRSQTCDQHRDDDYFVNYSKTSGGIFVRFHIMQAL
jgi:myo-inositol 2-dehydrogenase / D-chiro-inositol 1-dehydrogenase